MPDTTFENLMSVRQRAAEAFVSGDGAKVDSLVPQEGMASWHSPRGETVIGAENVATRYIKEAASFHSDGTTHFEISAGLRRRPRVLDRLPGCHGTDRRHAAPSDDASPRHGDLQKDRRNLEAYPPPCGPPNELRKPQRPTGAV